MGCQKEVRVWFDKCFGRTPGEWDAILQDVDPRIRAKVLGILKGAEIPPPPPQDRRIGSLGHYEVKLVRGDAHGGMGEVYEGRDTKTGDAVIIKFPRNAGGDYGRKLFQREQAAQAKVMHTGIARFLDAGVHDNEPYVVMERIDGKPIDEYCAGRKIDEIIEVFLQACEAVRHAHYHGIEHRDLKPGNILVDANEVDANGNVKAKVKVIDFGLAKIFDGGDRTQGLRGFSFPYASPEQVNPEEETDHRTDVYSLTAVLYELLTGEPLLEHPASDLPNPVRRVALERRTIQAGGWSLASQRTRVPTRMEALQGDLDSILRKGLAKDLSERYQDVDELVNDLNRYVTGEPVHAHPRFRTKGYKLLKYFKKHRLAMAALGGAVLFAGWNGHWAALSFRQRFSDSLSGAAMTEFTRTALNQPTLRGLANRGALWQLGPALETQRRLLVKLDRLSNEQLHDLVPDLANSWMQLAELYRLRGACQDAVSAAGRAAARYEQIAAQSPASSSWLTRKQTALGLAESCEAVLKPPDRPLQASMAVPDGRAYMSLEKQRLLFDRMEEIDDDKIQAFLPALAMSWMRLALVHERERAWMDAVYAADRAATRFAQLAANDQAGGWADRGAAARSLARQCRLEMAKGVAR